MPASHELTPYSGTSAIRRAAPPRVIDLDNLPDSAACTTRDVAALSGFAEITLKVWRKAGDRGPKVTRIEGRPRYLVKDIRTWMGSSVES